MSVKSSGACAKRIKTVFDKSILSQINEHREAADERITQNSAHKFNRRSSQPAVSGSDYINFTDDIF